LSKQLLESDFEDLQLTFVQYPQSFELGVHVSDLSVVQPSKNPNAFNEIITAKHKEGTDIRFFSLKYAHLPLNNPEADAAISVRMLPLKVMVNVALLDRVIDFFKVNKDEMEAISGLQVITLIKAAAQDAIQGVTAQTRAGLEFAIEEHKSLDIHIEIDAPIFFIPSKIDMEESPLLVLDVGHLCVKSEMLSREAKKQNISNLQFASIENLADFMYDKFWFELSAFRVT
jgi:vacuolar protein sorting-associated protein 13A/C